MEVTKNNFEEIFPEIVKEIKSASFICIDGEFTGLQNGHSIRPFDTPEDSYLKIRAGSMDFLFIQFGLSIFTQDEATGKYKNRTYVFYLFPWHRSSLAPDTRFLCQTSCINFLVSNKFDFNKLFREGIPYLNSSDESSFADAMETRRIYQANQAKDSPSQQIPIPKHYKATVDTAMKKIDKVVKGSEEEIQLEKQPAFVRKLIYQAFQQKYGNEKGIVLRSENGVMVCRRGEVEDREALDAKELETAVGFSRVIREISASGCLVVGHNMLLDLCHLVHRFMDPLPPDYLAFKEMLHTLFPRLVDTKFLSQQEPIASENLGSTTLQSLLEAISKPPFHFPSIDGDDGYSYEVKSGLFHDAGYDAYITGMVFLSFIRALDPDNKKVNLKDCRPLEKCMNKLHLMKAPDTYMDLVQDDPLPQRDHVFHLTFPSSWSSNNIAKLFSPYGGVQLSWLNDTSAWVSLHHKNEGQRALTAFRRKGSLPSGVTFTPYNRWVKEARQSNKRKAPPLPATSKKRKSSANDQSWNVSSTSVSPDSEELSPNQKESDLRILEEAASFDGGAFDSNASWD